MNRLGEEANGIGGITVEEQEKEQQFPSGCPGRLEQGFPFFVENQLLLTFLASCQSASISAMVRSERLRDCFFAPAST